MRLRKNENIGSYVDYYEESNQGFCGGSSRSQPLCHPLMISQTSCYFYKPIQAEDAVKLRSKVSDKNENGMRCGKCE